MPGVGARRWIGLGDADGAVTVGAGIETLEAAEGAACEES